MTVHFSKTQAGWLTRQLEKPLTDECILWPFPLNEDGYGKCRYHGLKVLAHRLAFFLTHGRWPFPETRHTCDVRNCINPRHLIEGTHTDNMRDRSERNKTFRGSTHPHAKITEEIVRKMRAEYIPRSHSNGTPALGIKYGLDRKNVYNIIMRRAWRHVE